MDVLSLPGKDRIVEAHLSNAARCVSLESFRQSENAYYDARAELLNASPVIKSGEGFSVHRTIQELAIVRMGNSDFSGVFEAVVPIARRTWWLHRSLPRIAP